MTSEHDHAGWAVWRPPARCTGCGHRVGTAPGEVPARTRDVWPWWLWPFELAGRLHTRLITRLPPGRRDGLTREGGGGA